jgi:lantibiotic leader peptide-processing serine protease
MVHINKFKLSHIVGVIILLLAGCESDLMDVDPIQSASVEELKVSSFDMSKIVEMTDFSNLKQGEFTGRFLILSKSQKLPDNLEESIQNAGGKIVKTFPQIGVAVAVALSGDFHSKASMINGIESVTPDIILQFTREPDFGISAINLEASAAGICQASTPFNYKDAYFDGYQWAPAAINAPDAWDAGITGKGIRVAVIDGGIHSTHIDLAPNLDIASSYSAVPGFNFNEDTGDFWHGTHVAGIVAASGLGIVGIAPQATIIGVKAMHSGSGSFEWILEAILYAATPKSNGGGGAHIINMSLGATFNYRDYWYDKFFRDAFRELQKTYDRATQYASQMGVTVIASAGNGANNYDEAKELFKIPAENRHVLSISATGPTGWLLGNTNFSQPAYYTDYGKSLVDFGAPGGSAGLWVVERYGGICTLKGTYASSTRPCYAFDMVFSSIRGDADNVYGWTQGTSMAAPAVAGVAALLMQANGGYLNPHQVRARLSQTATDLGKPGQDEYYGNGFVNAGKAAGVNLSSYDKIEKEILK